MNRLPLLLGLFAPLVQAHDIITTPITYTKEIYRIFQARCFTCHRPGGSSFSLMTYSEARPWAEAIKEEVLARTMPPWGAVKGFGDFRNDHGLTAEQMELIVDWEEGGAPEGDPKNVPPPPKPAQPDPLPHSPKEITVSGDFELKHSFKLDGLLPKAVGDGVSFQMTAELPDGSIEPLLWLENYKMQYEHAFLLRHPLELPAGTMIRGVPPDAAMALLPWKPVHAKK